MNEQTSNTLEEIKVRGNQLGERLREIIEEGNARRIIVKKEGRSVMELPLSVGVGGAAAALVLSPTLAAIGAFASLASDLSIAVEREHERRPVRPLWPAAAVARGRAGCRRGRRASRCGCSAWASSRSRRRKRFSRPPRRRNARAASR